MAEGRKHTRTEIETKDTLHEQLAREAVHNRPRFEQLREALQYPLTTRTCNPIG